MYSPVICSCWIDCFWRCCFQNFVWSRWEPTELNPTQKKSSRAGLLMKTLFLYNAFFIDADCLIRVGSYLCTAFAFAFVVLFFIQIVFTRQEAFQTRFISQWIDSFIWFDQFLFFNEVQIPWNTPCYCNFFDCIHHSFLFLILFRYE